MGDCVVSPGGGSVDLPSKARPQSVSLATSENRTTQRRMGTARNHEVVTLGQKMLTRTTDQALLIRGAFVRTEKHR